MSNDEIKTWNITEMSFTRHPPRLERDQFGIRMQQMHFPAQLTEDINRVIALKTFKGDELRFFVVVWAEMGRNYLEILENIKNFDSSLL